LSDIPQFPGLEGPASSLVPFAPLIYLAWADGVLTGAEIARIRRHIEATPWLDAEARTALDGWLNPARPPSPLALARLLAQLRDAARHLSPEQRVSLATLGSSLARDSDLGVAPGDVERALQELEASLGVAGGERMRALVGPAAPEPPAAAPATELDTAALDAFLWPDYRELRARVFGLLARPEFRIEPGLSRDAQRTRVRGWLRILADEGLGRLAYPTSLGGQGDMAAAITVFETLAFHDLSLVVKFGVQFGLFGGSILQLGTERHHSRYLRDIGALRLPGCYAMTEVDHGSNVRALETVARHIPETAEFEIHSPSAGTRKDWIGGAAEDARMATVFAQLEVQGHRLGVHAFVVPLRDPDGQPRGGVFIEDCGDKEGLNGVDNGRIRFHHVRIPADNLLDRFGGITEDGRYESPIASDGRRFFTMLATLVAGRISVASAANSTAKLGLLLAIRYTDRRRQFGPDGAASEWPVLDYLAQQRRLLPRLATCYALHFALRGLVRRYARVRPGQEVDREIELLAAGLKAYASQHAVNTLQQARQACGGRGYLASNRFGALMADTDVFTTFEGANLVLLQLVARSLLTELREHFGEMHAWGLVRLFGRRAATRVAETNPIATRRTDPAYLRDPEFHRAAFGWREDRLLVSAAARLRAKIAAGTSSFQAVNEIQDHLVSLARAHVERILVEAFDDAVAACDDVALRTSLRRLQALFALARLERDRAWFLESGSFEPVKSRAIRAQVNALCGEVRPDAVALVKAFGIPDEVVHAPMLRD
jgi:acyl-CoA oxidase